MVFSSDKPDKIIDTNKQNQDVMYITIDDLQGEWFDDCGDEFTITGTNLQFFDENKIFEIKEKEDYFIFNDTWILEKQSDAFMWTCENEKPVFWYRQIENENKHKDNQIQNYAKVIDAKPPICYICYDNFPVMMKYICGHEFCALCFEK